jgi:hypothetical protein
MLQRSWEVQIHVDGHHLWSFGESGRPLQSGGMDSPRAIHQIGGYAFLEKALEEALVQIRGRIALRADDPNRR